LTFFGVSDGGLNSVPVEEPVPGVGKEVTDAEGGGARQLDDDTLVAVVDTLIRLKFPCLVKADRPELDIDERQLLDAVELELEDTVGQPALQVLFGDWLRGGRCIGEDGGEPVSAKPPLRPLSGQVALLSGAARTSTEAFRPMIRLLTCATLLPMSCVEADCNEGGAPGDG
jgi:hypothetical protein